MSTKMLRCCTPTLLSWWAPRLIVSLLATMTLMWRSNGSIFKMLRCLIPKSSIFLSETISFYIPKMKRWRRIILWAVSFTDLYFPQNDDNTRTYIRDFPAQMLDKGRWHFVQIIIFLSRWGKLPRAILSHRTVLQISMVIYCSRY